MKGYLILALLSLPLAAFGPRHPRTAAEISASVIPANERYLPGDVRRYGAAGDNSNSDATAFQAAADVSAVHEMLIPAGIYLVNSPITFPTGATVRIRITGQGRPLVRTSVNGQRLFQAHDVGGFQLSGVRFQGHGSVAAPSAPFDGYAANATGIVTVTDSQNVRIAECEADEFHSGFSVLNSDHVWIRQNLVSDWLLYGIVASLSTDFHIEHNRLESNDQMGAENAYGIMATGDQAHGNTQSRGSISFNRIRGVPAWDGIMTHDADGLEIIGNDIRDVRLGIDIGHFDAANVIANIVVADNYIEGTTTNTWGAAPATSGGIQILGFDAAHRIANATVRGNVVKGFFGIAGTRYSGDFSSIVVKNIERATIADNVVSDAAGAGSAGIYVVGVANRLEIADNSLRGSMPAGGIRFAEATSDRALVRGNVIEQTATTDAAIYVTGSNLASFVLGANPTNAAAPSAASGSTITYSDPAEKSK